MSENRSSIESRRQFMKTAVVATAAVMAGGTIRKLFAAEPHLTDADPTAKAMDYVDDATTSKNSLYKPGSVCANCQLYTGGSNGYGNCQLFPGKLVSSKGWCTSYTAKAS
ncbi:MAG: high-potential iron-sulfur protein [Xanthomonadaceae bacterium]|nr:high-potential iron-sulfur protein [Xanthomonadaceae bacterium]